jgi:hypothetical protein
VGLVPSWAWAAANPESRINAAKRRMGTSLG